MIRWLTIAAFVLATLMSSGATAQQTSSERMYAAALKQGNGAYNKGDYKGAVDAFVTAIQASPAQSAAYRNLARSYFWQGNYSAAVEYYDHFLRLAGGDQDKLKAERRLAAERAGANVYTQPESQRLAFAAVERELESGRAYTSGGGGAWGRYETLLRTGFAEPQLLQVRTRLVRRLVDEFDANLIVRGDQLTPRLDLDDWQLQAERLAAAASIADDPAMLEVVQKRSTIAETAVAMLTSQWSNAADLAKLARTNNPDIGFVAWFEVTALIGAERYDEALLALVDLDKSFGEREVAKKDYVRVLRAVTLQRLNRNSDAAELYLEVLRH